MKRKGKRIQEIQEKKRKEKKRELTGFDFLPKAKSSHQKSYNSLQDWSLYRAPHEVKYHHALKKALNKEGKRRKQNKKVNKRGRENISHGINFAPVQKISLVHQFRTNAKIRTSEKFSHQCEIFTQGCEKLRFVLLLLLFCSSSALDFKSVKLVLARIHHAWIDSTNLALKPCKNYKN